MTKAKNIGNSWIEWEKFDFKQSDKWLSLTYGCNRSSVSKERTRRESLLTCGKPLFLKKNKSE